MNKKAWWAGGVIAVVLVVGLLYWLWGWVTIDPRQDFKSFLESAPRSINDIKIYDSKLLAAYKADTYGSTTPEGTLELFTTALEAGDTDLAAKYFIIDGQDKVLEDFRAGQNNGSINLLLSLIKKGKGVYYSDSNDKYQLRVKNDGGVVDFTIDLVLNPYTKVWKIESL